MMGAKHPLLQALPNSFQKADNLSFVSQIRDH